MKHEIDEFGLNGIVHLFLFILLCAAVFIVSQRQALATDQWRGDSGTDNTILGSESVSDIDAASYQNVVVPLDRMLAKFRQGAQIRYNSASSLTVESGQVMCENSDGSGHQMRSNTSSTTVAWTELDTGSEAASTTYYLYAVCDADAATFTVKISTSSTAPASTTMYRRLGSFVNDSSSNITDILNDGVSVEWGGRVSRTAGTVYQASTDGFVLCYHTTVNTSALGYNDWNSSPTTVVIRTNSVDNETGAISFPVQEGSYYKCESSGGATDGTVWFIPLD